MRVCDTHLAEMLQNSEVVDILIDPSDLCVHCAGKADFVVLTKQNSVVILEAP